MKVLLTTTSFQDTPGKHHNVLNDTGYMVDKIRGPVKEDVLLPIIADYDGVICGDDYYTKKVLKKGKEGKLKVISKYGIGMDKIDLIAADGLGITVTNCPGVNHITVAEHTFSLVLAFVKNISDEINYTRSGEWTRMIGREIYNKKLGVAGLGRIGKEVILRAKAFGMELLAYDQYFDKEFLKKYKVKVCNTLEELFSESDLISLNMSVNNENYHCISKDLIINNTKKGLLLVNTARGELVDENAIIYGIEKNILSGYLTDVLEDEPMEQDHSFRRYENIIITPHIASRTYESVERQGMLAVKNLIKNLNYYKN